MKKILLPITLSFLVLSGCSSKQIHALKAPSFKRLSILSEQFRTQKAASPIDESEEIALKFIEASQKEMEAGNEKVCEIYEELSSKRDFPLAQLAVVKTLQYCQYSKRELRNLWSETVIQPYMQEGYLDSILEQASKLQIDELAFNASLSLVDIKTSQSEKIKLLNQSLELAKRLNNHDFLARANDKLVKIAPRHSSEITPLNIYSVAKDFESNRQFEIARNFYLQIINSEFPLAEKVKAYNAYRTSFKVARDLKTFLEKTGEMELYLRQLLESANDEYTELKALQELQEAWVDAKINYARAVWTEHQNLEARDILDNLFEAEIGNPNQLATAYSVYGGLHLESKENEEAIEKYEKASELKITNFETLENVQWALVWNLYLSKEYNKTIKRAENFISKSINPNFIAKLEFWMAKSLWALGKKEDARILFAEIMQEDSFGYYGLLASMEIQSTLSPLSPTELSIESSRYNELDWLIGLKEKKLAMKFLKNVNSRFKSTLEREKAMSLYLQTEWYQGGMSQIFNIPIKLRQEFTTKYIDVIFPRAFENIFQTYAQKYQLPLAYSLAITRQESAFNPNVRSWADAFGLMQMIPEKAAELSKKYSIPYTDFNDLYQADLNIHMGTAFLSELKKKYKGQFIQTTAAYNASTSAIATWEKERFNGNHIEFIEMIPYEETRNYVKLVFRNYITYQRVLNSEGVLIPKNFFSLPF
ncbi:MAG: lytic transglycosylase domain-containing protein [Bacteriovoracaceae bacterium]|nr:lytic transglycosylase domain-containing protein [Bacteriovoracaceae bacterium]